jgi:hypothetical protein
VGPLSSGDGFHPCVFAQFFLIQGGDGLLAGRSSSLQTATASWLGFVRRPDVLAIMFLTALVTVLFVFWQRDQERK